MKNAKIRLCLVLYHEYPLSLESGIKPIKYLNISSLSDRKIQIKIFCVCCALPIAPFPRQRPKIDQNRSMLPQNDSDFRSYQKLEQDLIQKKKSAFKYFDFLATLCANIVFSIVPGEK